MQAMEQQSARHLAEAQQIQIKGTKGERREALRQKHRHQRAALANQVRAPSTSLHFCLATFLPRLVFNSLSSRLFCLSIGAALTFAGVCVVHSWTRWI